MMTAIAAMAEMSVANLYRIMSEETKSIPRETLRRLSEVLGVDFDGAVKQALLSEIEVDKP
jgi:transcriptional regulator with XRE-family HTH domain